MQLEDANQQSFFKEDNLKPNIEIRDFKALTPNQKSVIDFVFKKAGEEGLSFKTQLSVISEESGVKLSSLRTTINRLSEKGFFQKESSAGVVQIFVSEENLKKHTETFQNTFVSPKLQLVSALDTVVSDTKHNEHSMDTCVVESCVSETQVCQTKHTLVSKESVFKILSVGLCVLFTFFLVEEGRVFFETELKTGFSPFALSLGFELLLLFLAGNNFKTKFRKIISKLMLTVLFLFSIGSYSYISISASLKSFKTQTNNDQTLDLLKNEIKEKASLLKGYRKKGWVGEVRKLSREKQALTNKLMAKEEKSSKQLPFVFLIQLGLALVFRFLIQASNIFLVHELVGSES